MASLNKTKVVLDTSMLLNVEEKKIDVFSEIKKEFGKTNFYITDAVKKELRELEKIKKNKAKVSVALQLIEKNGVKIIVTGEVKADDSLLAVALKGMIVATADKELRKRIKDFGGKNIYLRKGKLVEFN